MTDPTRLLDASGAPDAASSRPGPWITLLDGRRFHLLDPRPEDVDPYVLASALAKVNRFGGHTTRPYSVAEHSMHVCRLVREAGGTLDERRAALLHDAAEAFIGDLPTPLKRLLPEYAAIERGIHAAVFARFGLPPDIPEIVKRADLIALVTENRDLRPEGSRLWSDTGGLPNPDPLILRPNPLGWRNGRERFLARMDDLWSGLSIDPPAALRADNFLRSA